MDLGLKERVAVVTGASRGIGRAIVEAYVSEGMKVVAAARSKDDLASLAARYPGSVHIEPCDMTDLVAVGDLPDVALSQFGGLDAIVSNAGIAPAADFVDMDAEEWQKVMTVNLFAPVALARAAFPAFNSQQHGKVIHVASTSGLRGKPSLAAYSSSKGAMLRLTESLAGEWARFNIQVNAIAPGAFATEAQRKVLDDPEILTRRLRKIPAGRMGDPQEIGPLACYLASGCSDFVTGATFVIDGGEAAKL